MQVENGNRIARSQCDQRGKQIPMSIIIVYITTLIIIYQHREVQKADLVCEDYFQHFQVDEAPVCTHCNRQEIMDCSAIQEETMCPHQKGKIITTRRQEAFCHARTLTKENHASSRDCNSVNQSE